MLQVVVAAEWGQHKGTRWQIGSGESKLFGRSDRADVVISNDNLCSSTHFRLFVDDQLCVVEDLNSTNGTFVNNRRVSTQTLQDGDKVRAGRSVFEIRIEVIEPEPRQADDPASNADSKDDGSQTFKATVTNEEASAAPLIDAAIPSPIEPQIEPQIELPIEPSFNRAIDSYSLAAPNRAFVDAVPVFVAPPAGVQLDDSAVPTGDYMVELRRCSSGLWRATRAKANLDPAAIVDSFGQICAMVYLIDFPRTGLESAALAEAVRVTRYGSQSIASQFVRPAGFEQREMWVRRGWGHDGFTALFTFVDVSEVVGRFQQAVQDMNGDPLSRPSEFEQLMREGPAELVNELIYPCEAILFDSPDSPGGWSLFGDDRLRLLLADCGISFCVTPQDQSVTDLP
jgi:hypothetical protein